MAAAVLRSLTVLIPAAAAILVTAFLNRVGPRPQAWAGRIGWWVLLLAVSTLVATVVERQMRRIMPLAVLLRMTLLFPDKAPSRYKVARAGSNPARLADLAKGKSARSQAAAQVLAWVAQLSKHDKHTRGHSERVRVYADLLAEQLGITGSDRDKLRWAALLHDIGKLQVPGNILNKPGRPSGSEWKLLRQHPEAGTRLLGALAEWLGPWAGGIRDHHERWDGTGYPAGRSGSNISLAGRVVAVADAYETMTAARAYKRPMATAAARAELARCAGMHFDPTVVRAFLRIGLPRLMWAIGPVSFLFHLPFLSRIPDAGLGLVNVANSVAAPAAATLTAAAVSTAAVVSPVSAAGLFRQQPAPHGHAYGVAKPAGGLARGHAVKPDAEPVSQGMHKRSTPSAPASATPQQGRSRGIGAGPNAEKQAGTSHQPPGQSKATSTGPVPPGQAKKSSTGTPGSSAAAAAAASPSPAPSTAPGRSKDRPKASAGSH